MDWPGYVMPPPPIFSTAHMLGRMWAGLSSTTPLGNTFSVAWPIASYCFYLPFTLTDWATCYQLFWYVGATQAGNIDMAIIDSQKHRIVSAGSTACGAINAIQEVNITDTLLAPGQYFFGVAADSVSTTMFLAGATLTDETQGAAFPVYEEAAFPIPATINPTLMTQPTTNLPLAGMQLRSVF